MDKEKLTSLLHRSQSGDQNAMEDLLRFAHTSVSYQCRKLLKNQQDAEDVTQEVLLTVYTKLDTLQNPAAFMGWLNRITANRCVNALTRGHKELQFEEDEEGHSLLDSLEELDEQQIPDKALDNAETTRMIEELVDALPELQRMCVLLYYYDEMSVSQIAKVMSTSENTVKSRLNYARKSIKEGVVDYEKKGVKLYSVSVLPFLLFFLRKAAESSADPAAAQAAVEKVMAEGAATAATGAAAGAGTAAGGAAAGISAKVIAGILACAVALGGLTYGVSVFLNQRQEPEPDNAAQAAGTWESDQSLEGKDTLSSEDPRPTTITEPTEQVEPTEPEEGTPIELIPLVLSCQEMANLQSQYQNLSASADEDAFMANVEALDAHLAEDSKNARVPWYNGPSGISWTWYFPNFYNITSKQVDVVWLCFEDNTDELLAYTVAVYDPQTGLFSDVKQYMTSIGASYSYAAAGGINDHPSVEENADAVGANNPLNGMPNFAVELDPARVDRDNGIVAEFLDTVCTWDSYVEYTAAREKIMADYGLSEDSQFMSVFMPEIPNRIESDGTYINRIDVMGLNMHYHGIESYVIKIAGGKYTYFTIVDIQSTWKNGGESVVHAVLLCTVNAGGEISNLYAVPLAT